MTADDVIGLLRALPEPPPLKTTSREALRRAAVLVPLIDRPEGLTVLLCERSKHLERHPGEVSFPGGRIEPGEDEVAAALRESREEIGLDPDRVAVCGRLGTQRAGSGYAIAPIVGLARPPLDFALDGIEVDEVFEVPLGFLLDPANRRSRGVVRCGARRRYSLFAYDGHVIWGATAAVLVNLARVLGGGR